MIKLVDYFAFRPHLNWLYRFASDEGPSWGLVAGVSPTVTASFKPTWNAIAGVTLHPDGKPNDVMAAFVVTLKDFTDSNDKELEFFKDQFSVRLYVAVDLKLGP